MSTVAAVPTPPPPPPSPPATTPSPSTYFATIGLGYSIAIALGFLVLLSTILLSSYICCRASRRRSSSSAAASSTAVTATSDGGVILPRIIFVAEDDDVEGGVGADGENVVVGLDQSVINSYPKFQFSKEAISEPAATAAAGDATTCSICLCEYKEAEMLRMMPECRHYFHLCCLDAWLKLNGSCPVCRNSPLPTPQSTPLSTPLSEVVPLSQYAADRRRSRR